jgi:di/tricarboxylate transporter
MIYHLSFNTGNYKFFDFARLGLPLSLFMGVLTLVLTPLIFPF